MNSSSIIYPSLPVTIGKKGKAIIPVTNRIRRYEIIDEIKTLPNKSKTKAIYLQLLKFDDNIIELCLGYYIIGKKPKMKDNWTWGQFATMLQMRDFKKIYKLAEKKNWFNKYYRETN